MKELIEFCESLLDVRWICKARRDIKNSVVIVPLADYKEVTR